VAIRVLPFYAIVLRPLVSQDLNQPIWRMLLKNAVNGLFDGEIMAFPSMELPSLRTIAGLLKAGGYNGPEHGDHADFVWFERGEGKMPNWLEKVELRFFDSDRVSAAWKMVNSEVYSLVDQNDQASAPTKGYQVDWPPFIGRIDK